jgi:hypothetical protein
MGRASTGREEGGKGEREGVPGTHSRVSTEGGDQGSLGISSFPHTPH